MRAAARVGVQGKVELDKLGLADDGQPPGGEEHCLAASDGLQIDPICAPHLIGAAGPTAAHNGGDARFAESDADYTARVERETQLA